MAQVDPRPLDKFQSVLGGQLRRYAVTQGGNRAPYKTVWYAWGPTAAAALTEMLPFLQSKREQAMVAIEFQATKTSVARRRCTDDERAMQKRYSDELKRLREEVRANS